MSTSPSCHPKTSVRKWRSKIFVNTKAQPVCMEPLQSSWQLNKVLLTTSLLPNAWGCYTAGQWVRGPSGRQQPCLNVITEINPARRHWLEAARPVVWLQCGKRSADLFPAGNHRGSSGKWLKNGECDTEWHGFQSRVGAGGTHGFPGPSAVSGVQCLNAPTVADFINVRIRLLFHLFFYCFFSLSALPCLCLIVV